ncbi:UNVERIFIED_ORG: hypothetical protein J2Y76_005196 [Pseudomonas reinekei]|uniref:hypothetical protein n=1 Tax=Pseudomonas laurylsulfatiphila TaxID=2011015 RepID=UPI003D2121AA|nr:hypothetical protein [Pseudomonas reinekei]
MDEYKLTVEDFIGKPINKDAFEADTLRREPWYQEGSADKQSQFAVCPACDNPIQLVGLYHLPANVNNPYGKHTTSDISGIASLDVEARDHCPYFKPRQHQKTDRKAKFDGVPRKIVRILIEQFDRVVYILEKQTRVALSANTLKGMLERYKGEQGYLYTGATLRNVPWIFAYMSDATALFAQRVGENHELTAAIRSHVPAANIDTHGRLRPTSVRGAKDAFIDLKMSFIQHRIIKDSEASGLKESMVFVVSHSRKGQLVDIYKQDLTFDPVWFDRLIQMPIDHPNRRMDRVDLAREALGDLL